MCQNIREGFNHTRLELDYTGFKDLSLNEKRKRLRDELIEYFKNESPGTGTQRKSSRWVYCVADTLNQKNVIYLQRPASLNKGFDFTVNTSNIDFFAPTKLKPIRTTKTPRHDSLYLPLNYLKLNLPERFSILREAIEQTFLCNDTIQMEMEHNEIFTEEFIYSPTNSISLCIDCKTILHTIKWLFMEQDITYWSFTGRYMYYGSLVERYGFASYHPE
jgi:hypothetical protein